MELFFVYLHERVAINSCVLNFGSRILYFHTSPVWQNAHFVNSTLRIECHVFLDDIERDVHVNDTRVSGFNKKI